MKYRIVTFLVFGTALFFLAEQNDHAHRMPFTETLDRVWLGFCIANSTEQISNAAVTLVRIDDSYESALPSDILTRLDYAVILANIEKFKPRSVSIVPTLVWAEPNIINQKVLESQCLKMPPLTLGTTVENSPDVDKSTDPSQYGILTQIEGNTSQITLFTRTVTYPQAESRANGSAAFTEIELSNAKNKEGALTVPLLANYNDKLVASFILLSIVKHAQLELGDVSIQLPPAVAQGKILIGDQYTIPIDPAGRMKVHEHAEIFPPLYQTINATELPLAHSEEPSIIALQKELEDEFQSLSSNLIVLGLDREKDQLISLNSGEKISLAKLITRSIATIQSGRYIEQWPLQGRLLGFAVIVLVAFRLYRLSRRQVFVWACLMAFLYTGGSVLIFKSTLLWTPPFASLSLFATLILIGMILPYVPANTIKPSESTPEEKSENVS